VSSRCQNKKNNKISVRDSEQTVVGIECGIGIRRQGSRYDSRRQASRCNTRRQASRYDCGRHKIGSCSERHIYKMGCWETGHSHERPKAGFQGEATGDKSLNRELRETGVRTGVSPTGRTHHGHPGRLTLSRQNIFFPDIGTHNESTKASKQAGTTLRNYLQDLVLELD